MKFIVLKVFFGVFVCAPVFFLLILIDIWPSAISRGGEGYLAIAFLSYIGIASVFMAKLLYRFAFPLPETDEQKEERAKRELEREKRFSILNDWIFGLEFSAVSIQKLLEETEAVFTSGRITKTVALIRENRKQILTERSDERRMKLSQLPSSTQFEGVIADCIASLDNIQKLIDAFGENIRKAPLNEEMSALYIKREGKFRKKLKCIREVARKYVDLRI